MRKILLLLLILITSTIYSTPPDNVQQVKIGVNMTPLISHPGEVVVGEEFNIVLINGLQPDMVTWKYDTISIITPSNLILKFDKPGDYIPHIRNVAQRSYIIKVIDK